MKVSYNQIFVWCFTLTLPALILASLAWAHEGHDDAPGEHGDTTAAGPIEISAEAKKNLNITTYEVQVATLQETLSALGQIEPIPGRASAISSRISGRVSALYVNDGQTVKKGQPLVQVESRQLGDPPPRVAYDAPFDGVIIDRHAVLGDTVEPDKHLMEVVDPSELYAEGRVYEGQIAAVKLGQLARVRVEAFSNETYEGLVDLMSGALDPVTRTLKIWVRLKNPDGKLRPNMRATLHIVVREAVLAVAVPSHAILGDSGEKFVFVQSDSNELIFERRRVVTGLRDDRYTEIVEGVFPGDKVVTEGGYQLQYVSPKPAKKG